MPDPFSLWLGFIVGLLVGAWACGAKWRARLRRMVARKSMTDPGYRRAVVELLEAEGFQLYNDSSTGHP